MRQTYSISATLLISLLFLTACEQKCHIVMRNNQGGINWHSIHTLSATEQDTLNRVLMSEIQYDDSVPDFSRALLVSEAKNYDDMDINSFAVYTKPYTVNNPRTEKQIEKMAIWCTKEATYLAIVDEQMWTSRYHQTSKEVHLRDSQTGKTYPIIKLLGYPLEQVYWIEGIPGEWRCRVLVFPPLPKQCTTIDFITDGPKPKHVKGTTGWAIRKSLYKIPVSTLQAQQHIATFKETVVVE